MRRTTLAVLLAAGLAAAGCLESGGTEKEDAARLERLRREIEASVPVPRCEDGAQCGSIAFGSKPCGGPWKYLIYSSAHTDTAALRRRVEDFNAYEAELNRKWGWASDCMAILPPRLGCENGVCVDLNRK